MVRREPQPTLWQVGATAEEGRKRGRNSNPAKPSVTRQPATGQRREANLVLRSGIDDDCISGISYNDSNALLSQQSPDTRQRKSRK